jgi:hypothetical protein
VINAERTAGLRRLFLYKLLHYPVQTFRLLRRFTRYMPLRDVVHLIVKPFLGNKQGPTKNEVLSRAIEYPAMKDAAGDFTNLPDALIVRAINTETTKSARDL